MERGEKCIDFLKMQLGQERSMWKVMGKNSSAVNPNKEAKCVTLGKQERYIKGVSEIVNTTIITT